MQEKIRLDSIEDALKDIHDGKFVIVVDDEDAAAPCRVR